jgi:holo-[acyl-carrier protein] synthase
MIVGIGIDVVEIRRIEDMIEKYGDRFLRKVFTETEIAYCGNKVRSAVHYAGRWAVKEAFYKALPRECQTASGWKSIELVSDGNSPPYLAICDNSFARKIAGSGVEKYHVSISHEKSICVAAVVLESAK